MAIITDVLSMTCEGTEGDSSAHDTHSVRLHTVLQLWAVAKNVFTRTWLTESARSLLGAVFKYPFPLGVDEVKATWSVLCSDLALLGAPDLLSTILISSGNHRTTSIQRQMWTILAENWSSSSDRISWKHMASFLSIPMR